MCDDSYVTPDAIAEFFCRGEGYGATSEPTLDDVKRYIAKGASRINVTLSATAQCDCTFNAYADEYLQELNLVAAILLIHCPDCSRHLPADDRTFYHGWLSEQLELLRSGKLDLCAGATAVDYPAFGVAQYALTNRNAARMILNHELRTG